MRLLILSFNNLPALKNGFVPEYHLLVSNPELLFSLGYVPKVSFESLNKLMLN